MKMSGVESVVGAYLALIIVVGTTAGLYVWSKQSTLYLKEGIDVASARFQYVLNPPILSLNYSGNNSLLLTIYPRVPFRVKEVIIKNLYGELVYHKYLDVFVENPYKIELPPISEPSHILVVSSDNVIYYYDPRGDPNLLTAPDYIKNKSYVDYELVEYLSSNNNSTSSLLVVLYNYGYKLHAGKVVNLTLYRNNEDFRKYLFLVGPVDCIRVREVTSGATYYYLPCNVELSTRRHFVTYGLYARLSTSPYYSPSNPYYFVQNGDLLTIGTGLTESGYNYFQVYRLLKFTGSQPREFDVTIKIRAYDRYGRAIRVDLMPVVYIYDSDTSPFQPVALAIGYQVGPDYKLWLNRTLLETNYIVHSSAGSWMRTYRVVIDPSTVGATSLLAIVGVEVVLPSTGGYVEVEISISA
jgi:hypothetical protein